MKDKQYEMSADEFRQYLKSGGAARLPSAGSYTPKRNPPGAPEHEMQCQIYADFLRDHPDLAGLLFAIPNGAKLPYKNITKRNGQTVRVCPEAKTLLQEGLTPGIPDMMLSVARGGWYGLFIENKIHPNKPSPEQLSQMKKLTAQGYLCQVCYTREAARAVIATYLALPVIAPAPPDEFQLIFQP